MKLDFIKLSPTQNMTVLVSTPVDRESQPEIAARLMDYSSVNAEQVGFREAPTLPGAVCRLQMMGGEFCGNAAMSMAVCLAREAGIMQGERMNIPVEVSGVNGLTMCSVEALEDGFRCRVEMPLPESFEEKDGYILVRMPGIVHAVMPRDDLDISPEEAEKALRSISETVDCDAVGLILWRTHRFEIRPLVYVRGTDSFVWERGCGSGSAAVGALTAWRMQDDVSMQLRQPGGIMTAVAKWKDGEISEVYIEGDVKISCEGTALV